MLFNCEGPEQLSHPIWTPRDSHPEFYCDEHYTKIWTEFRITVDKQKSSLQGLFLRLLIYLD